mgnify:FL=1
MSYTADSDVLSLIAERVIIQLSADDPLAGVPDWAVVAEARAYADAQVDARLRQRYALPLASVPRELKDWALALARRWLYERRPDQDIPAAVLDAAKEALASLDAIRDGKLSLDIPDDGTGGETVGSLAVGAPVRVYDATWLARYDLP